MSRRKRDRLATGLILAGAMLGTLLAFALFDAAVGWGESARIAHHDAERERCTFWRELARLSGGE